MNMPILARDVPLGRKTRPTSAPLEPEPPHESSRVKLLGVAFAAIIIASVALMVSSTARANAAGEPTPEGSHRDGVDYVLVLLVNRQNIASGTTTIHTPDGKLLGDFTLTHPLDAALVYDHSVYHGVTPVSPLDADQPAFRDVLVVTFKAASPSE